jgi:hypothetical protein
LLNTSMFATPSTIIPGVTTKSYTPLSGSCGTKSRSFTGRNVGQSPPYSVGFSGKPLMLIVGSLYHRVQIGLASSDRRALQGQPLLVDLTLPNPVVDL